MRDAKKTRGDTKCAAMIHLSEGIRRQVGFNFHFQIANGSGRKACCVRVQAHNYHDATSFFRQNWPTTQLMARECLASDGKEIKLTIPFPEPH